MNAIQNRNIVSVAWSDHIIFGEGDGRLDTVPVSWQSEFSKNNSQYAVAPFMAHAPGFWLFTELSDPPACFNPFIR
jgi:hypothetical protein